MVNREHFLLLFRSIASGNCRAWNNWRIEHREFKPYLVGLELWDVKLPHLNLSRGDLRLANLRGINFYRANMENSDLSMAVLEAANLREANLRGAKLFYANLKDADLRGANLAGADLRQANLKGALLQDAKLTGALMDPGALEQTEDLYAGSEVSRLEKIALRLSKRRAAKRIYPALLKAKKAFRI
jgi:uncharacterized protein YjbI with pentapeptide repeats